MDIHVRRMTMKHGRSESYYALAAVRYCEVPGQYLGHECPSYRNRGFGLGDTQSARAPMLLVSPTRVFPPRSDGQPCVAGNARVKQFVCPKFACQKARCPGRDSEVPLDYSETCCFSSSDRRGIVPDKRIPDKRMKTVRSQCRPDQGRCVCRNSANPSFPS